MGFEPVACAFAVLPAEVLVNVLIFFFYFFLFPSFLPYQMAHFHERLGDGKPGILLGWPESCRLRWTDWYPVTLIWVFLQPWRRGAGEGGLQKMRFQHLLGCSVKKKFSRCSLCRNFSLCKYEHLRLFYFGTSKGPCPQNKFSVHFFLSKNLTSTYVTFIWETPLPPPRVHS